MKKRAKKKTAKGKVWLRRAACGGVIFTLTAAGLAGCGGEKGMKTDLAGEIANQKKQDSAAVSAAQDPAEKAQQSAEGGPECLTTPDAALTAQRIADKGGGVNGFALAMGSLLYEEHSGQSFVCSPISLWLPLAALLNGTDESCREQALQSLGLEGMSVEEVNGMARELLDSLTGGKAEGELPELQIANAIFVDRDYKVDSGFEKAFSGYYDGEAFTVDFEDSASVKAVNDWASDHTNGEIPHILDSVSPSTAAAIANAVYFSDRFSTEFSETATEDGIFHGAGGDRTERFMYRGGSFEEYYEDERLQAVRLGFNQGAALYILLPLREEAGDLYRSLNTADLEKIQEKSIPNADGTLKLPKFEIDGGSMNLMGFLEKIGSPVIDAGLLPLTGLVRGQEPLFVDQAVQRARIRVDEKGTTAAAVTVMTARAMGALKEPETKPFEMVCDRPFVFLLTKSTKSCGTQILFSGVVQ